MALMKRNPLAAMEAWNREWPIAYSLERLQRDMNKLFGDFFRGDIRDRDFLTMREWSPSVDVTETKDAYVMKAELPGVSKNDVKITLDNNMITIRGEKRSEEEKNIDGVHRTERRFGTFERSFSLPGSVRSDQIDARFADGVLTITVPKTEESKQRVVDVKVK